MKHNSILKNSAIRSVVLAGIMMYTVASVSHAQTGATGHDIAPIPGQDGSAARQPSPGQQGATPNLGGSLPKNGNAASGQGTSDQTDASPLPSSANQESGPGGHERGSLLWTGKLMLLYQLVRRIHETYPSSYFYRRI